MQELDEALNSFTRKLATISQRANGITSVVTAIARNRPARMCGIEAGRLSKPSSTCPPSRSVIIGVEPRYVTWT